jgi:hypothetical protein
VEFFRPSASHMGAQLAPQEIVAQLMQRIRAKALAAALV